MDQLGINIPLLVAQVINFFVVLLALRFFLYRPVLNLLDRRAQRVREGLEAAEQSKEQAAQAEQQVAQQLEGARRQGQALIAQAQESANRIQEDARSQARRESEALLERARNEIQLERDQAIAELRKEFGDLTVRAAEKVIGQSLDRQAHQRLIDEALAESTFREG
ncbi:MAG: ATP synthase F0 subunit B [Chloroflexi bacterium RBG_16_68_14]|nr:MAG: ATP synthase F0 subunit B [Chloroflexi bacterium RBG_16_68_14]